MTPIFLDHNSTTSVAPEVLKIMLEELERPPSNPSSIHFLGKEAKLRLSKARASIAQFLHALPEEIIFTSSATEALNLAIYGLEPKGEIISSEIEHAAVYNPLKKRGNPLIYLPVDKRGYVTAKDLEKALSPNTSLIVLSSVNSETGIKNPIEEIAALSYRFGIPLIVDAVASLGKEPLPLFPGVTALALSAHKIHGPKGVGALFVRKQTRLRPLFTGGEQEFGVRPGTENLAGILGFAKAIELLVSALPHAGSHMEGLRNHFEASLLAHYPSLVIHKGKERICNTSSLLFPHISGEELLIHLDLHKVCASMGSACSSGAAQPSRVLLKMGLTPKEALSTLRFSLSRFTTQEEIEKALEILSSYLK